MARQVNTKFLIILLAVVVGTTGGLFFAKKLFAGRGDSKKLLAEGDKLFQAGDYDKAREKYQLASAAAPGSTEPLLKLGDACAKLTPEDPAYLDQAHNHWKRALSVDPRCGDALNRL